MNGPLPIVVLRHSYKKTFKDIKQNDAICPQYIGWS